MIISIRPHHLLDAYKLYGRGIYPLSPDTDYGHDFYLIGNLLINHKVDSVILLNKADDICKPCKYYKNGICVDTSHIGGFNKKHDYNCFIDKRLLQHFKLQEDVLFTLDTLLSSFIKDSTIEIFCSVWFYNEDNEFRFMDTITGIKEYFVNSD